MSEWEIIEKYKFQAAKWNSIQVLLDPDELKELCKLPFEIFPLSGIDSLVDLPFSKERFVTSYAEIVNRLKSGEVNLQISQSSIRAVAWLEEGDAPAFQELKPSFFMARPQKPYVRVELHEMIFSEETFLFKPMIRSKESIFWGLQFSYPQIYQETSGAIQNSPKSLLFSKIRSWVRDFTVPTPIGKGDLKQNFSIRIGKKCFSWIDQHAQLNKFGLKVLWT
jgi:hypothetical protein